MEKIENSFEGNKKETEKERLEKIKNDLFSREVPEEYKELAAQVKLIELSAPYAENLHNLFYEGNKESEELSELGKIISETAKGEIVLDLGCGKTHYLSSFFSKNGADLYIGVDLEPDIYGHVVKEILSEIKDRSYMRSKSHFCSVVENDNEKELKDEKKDQEPVYELQGNKLQVKDDMLKAASRIKSESVNLVIVGGIEMSAENIKETTEYLSFLELEIERILKSEGMLLVYQSDFSMENFSLINEGSDGSWCIFKKNE